MFRPCLIRGSVVIVLALGCWASARGDDDAPTKSSWSAKLWPWSSTRKVPEGKKDASGQAASSQKSEQDAAHRLQAERIWLRRAEVCQKLRQIAYETNDEELERFVDRLDQRAWDSYYKQSQGGHLPLERIGIDFSLNEPAPKTLGSASKTREVQP